MLVTSVVDLADEYEGIKNDCRGFMDNYPFSENRQICLTHLESAESVDEKVYRYSGSLKGTGYKEFDFHAIHKDLSKSAIGVFLNRIKEKWLLGRVRLCLLPPRTCYSIHIDYSPVRFHLPIVTNEHAYIMYPQYRDIFHIPADGQLYEVNTYQEHTAINCGNSDRIHMVLEIAEKGSVFQPSI